jgi:hypothetical protein
MVLRCLITWRITSQNITKKTNMTLVRSCFKDTTILHWRNHHIYLYANDVPHNLQQAGEMAFMDASGSLDCHNNPVYFPSGVLPLAVWVTSSQSEAIKKCCLHNVISVMPKHAFGGKGPGVSPSIFLTDDDSAQRNALCAYWHSSALLLCIFLLHQVPWPLPCGIPCQRICVLWEATK